MAFDPAAFQDAFQVASSQEFITPSSRVTPADPLLVTVTPVSGTERPLRLEGHPTFSAARGVGCETASIPVAREELDAPDLQGAVVRIHGAGWWGVIIERPEPGRPLSVLGYGAWAGSLVKYSALYSATRVDDWTSWEGSGDGITPAIQTPNGWYFGITKGVPLTAYANRGVQFYDPRGISPYVVSWTKTKANANYGIVIYEGSSEGVIRSTVTTSTDTSGLIEGVPGSAVPGLPSDTTWVAVALYTTAAFTPSAGSEGIYVTVQLWGKTITYALDEEPYEYTVLPTSTDAVVYDVLMNAIPLDYRLADPVDIQAVAQQHSSVDVTPYSVDSATPNEVFADLMVRAPIEYGWYDRHGVCAPDIADRTDTPAYILSLDSLETPPSLDYARLDEMTSGTVVNYRAVDGSARALTVPDTDPTHPLVALGITRYDSIDVDTTDAAEAAAIGAAANAENGRMRVRGSVTVRDEMRTIDGAPVDRHRVRPGEMLRLIGTRAGTVDVRIHRVTWLGDVMTLELDGSGWRLDAYLASLDARR